MTTNQGLPPLPPLPPIPSAATPPNPNPVPPVPPAPPVPPPAPKPPVPGDELGDLDTIDTLGGLDGLDAALAELDSPAANAAPEAPSGGAAPKAPDQAPVATQDGGQSKKLVIGAIALGVAIAVGGGAYWKIQGDKEVAQKEEAVRVEAQAKAAAEAAQRADAEAKRAAEAQAALESKQKQVDELAAKLAAAETPNDLAGQIANAHGNAEQKTAEAGQASVPKPYSAIPVAKALPHINIMLKAAYQSNSGAILEAVKAIEGLQKPERGDRKLARALNDDGLRLLKANDFAQAEAAFMRAAEVDPTDREIAGNLGFTYEKMGRFDDAVAANAVAITLEPSQGAGWGGMGLALAKQGKESDAVAAFQLAHRFAKNPTKTADYFGKMAESDSNQKVREAAGKAYARMTAIN